MEREEDDRLGTGEGRGMMDWRGGGGGGGMDTHILTREVLMVGGMETDVVQCQQNHQNDDRSCLH